MLAAQWTRHNYRDTNRQRLYLKDIDCPTLWHDKLKEQIPPSVFYLNDSVGEIGGAGSKEERYANGVGSRLGRGIAKAGDLMSCMPPAMRAENLMCYIGHEGTYTPAHREMCASIGQNIMVEASGNIGDDGKATRPGSSIWFMTETKDRRLTSEYWLSSLGHDIEVESHFASVDAWIKAPFKVWVVEQKVGDFVLIPPLAPHQVWNRGTRTMKVAWNRTTVETLEYALREALPAARMVCRDEQYKNKAIILFTLNKYSGHLRSVERQKHVADDQTEARLISSSKIRQLEKDFKRLFALFIDIMLSETVSPPVTRMEYVPYDSNITCSYCRCNIFNRFLTCKHCIVLLENGEEDTYDICLDCYAMGRSCKCLSRLTWVEQFPFKDLLEKYNIWRGQINKLPASSEVRAPLPLDEEKQRYGKKTLADICVEQLKVRPFKDPNEVSNDQKDDNEEEESEVNDNGTIRKKAKKKPEKWYKDHPRCHTCSHRHVKWKVAICSCGVALCYGSLWRGFDEMPQATMEDPNWRCPKCRKICSCRDCMKDPENQPYEPKGTVLGHDTRKFADPRSVESLVDFSSSNMHWLRKAGDDSSTGSRRISRHADAAAQERATDIALSDHYVDIENRDEMVIDPLLGPILQAEDGEGEQVGIQQAAADALNMMSGLSALERDPEAFMTQAGLGQNSMHEHSYEYPDPEESPIGAIPTTEIDETETPNKRRKRGRDAPIVQSDAPLSEANAKFQRQQAQDRMKEAKRKGHYISTQAAIRGRSLLLRLPVDPAILARFSQKYPLQPTAIEPEASQELVNVQSDLPKNISEKFATSKNPMVPKKRTRAEEDDDFFASKQDRRANEKPKGGKKLVSNVHADPAHSDSGQDAEVDFDDEELSSSHRQSNVMTGSRRSLPSYLARRSPVNTTNLPSELTGTAPKRVKRKSAVFTNGTNQQPMHEPSPIHIENLSQSPALHQTNGLEASTKASGQAQKVDRQRPKAPTAPMLGTMSNGDSAPSAAPGSNQAITKQPSLPERAVRKPVDTTPDVSVTSRAKTKLAMGTKAQLKASPRSMPANMKAKLVAFGQAVDESGLDSESETSSPASEVVSNVPRLSFNKRGRGRPPKATADSNSISKPMQSPVPPSKRRSIFSKANRGIKIKITSARASAKS